MTTFDNNHNPKLTGCAIPSAVGSTSFNTTGNIFASFSPKTAIEYPKDENNPLESRLLSCRKSAVMLKCDGCRVTIAVPKMCKSRFCVSCAKYLSGRAKKVLIGIIKERDLFEKKHLLRFLTLTCLNFPGDMLKDGLDSMNRWYSRLLRRKITAGVIEDTIKHVKDTPELLAKMEMRYKNKGGWELVYRNFKGKRFKHLLAGGIKRFEITKGQDGNYHLHLHIFYEGGFIPQPILSQVWSDIVSKDGWSAEVTDIRAVKNVRKGIKEIAKYAFKPDGLTLEDKIFLDGLFQNRRLYSFFGEWFTMLRPGDIEYLVDATPLSCPCCGGRSFAYDGQIEISEMTDRWVYESQLDLWLFYPDDYLRNQGWSTFDELEEDL